LALVVKGDLVRVELADGGLIELPDDWGLVHDTEGRLVDRCTFLVLPYTKAAQECARLSKGELVAARNYFGKSAQLTRATVEIPSPLWQRFDDAVVLYYARMGKRKGRYRHRFSVPCPFFFHEQGLGYMLVLPDGCVVDERGFVWP